MKKFVFGFVAGLIIGALGTVGLGIYIGTRASKATGLSLSDEPIATMEALSSFLDKHPYEVGFFAREMKTGKIAERSADRSVCLASIVKLFCLTELYRQKHEESLDLNQRLEVPKHGSITLLDAANLMIGRSDNAATQSLAEFLGREAVNRIPGRLGLEGMSDGILPSEATLRQTLDKRVFGKRHAEPGLPMHGTSRGMASYFDLLLSKKVFSVAISEDLIEFLNTHPKPFSTHYAGKYNFAGKGGNLLWTRPPKHYSMMGWSLFLTKQPGEHIVLCVWGEWFPENIPPEKQSEFLKFVTDSVIRILEGE